MMIKVGRVRELFRYPVKSMAPVAIETAFLGWHGVAGDRRFAFRRAEDTSGFPWLTASRLPSLIRYQPFGVDIQAQEPIPTHVRTPEGVDVPLRGEELCADIAQRFGSTVELMHLKHGIFDAASISVIALATILGIERAAGTQLDTRRFRPNIVLDTPDDQAFQEDSWVGARLVFGDDASGAAINITMPDERCMMINLDPETAVQNPAILRSVVNMNEHCAGVYATVVREGELAVGQRVTLIR